MKNSLINIKLGTGIKTVDQKNISSGQSFSVNLGLDPLYATTEDVLERFVDEETHKYSEIAKKFIFEASQKADMLFSKAKLSGASTEEIYYLKREYSICYAIYKFAKVFNRDFLTSVKKQKFVADVKVSIDIAKDPSSIREIGKDAESCTKDLESLLDSSSQFGLFVKGQNSSKAEDISRRWYPSENGKGLPREPIAASKYYFNNRLYKIGRS